MLRCLLLFKKRLEMPFIQLHRFVVLPIACVLYTSLISADFSCVVVCNIRGSLQNSWLIGFSWGIIIEAGKYPLKSNSFSLF